jgi:inosose dehydratase
MDRRKFLTASGTLVASSSVAGGAAVALSATPASAAEEQLQPLPPYRQDQPYRISYTSNTRGGWEGDPFKGMREGREVGFRYFEIFGNSFAGRPDGAPPPPAGSPERIAYYPDNYEALMRRIMEMDVAFCSITGGAPGGATDFENPASRQAVVQNHFDMARFSRRFGAYAWKTNLGRRRPEGTTNEDLKNMAETCNVLGKRMRDELGMKLGVHPHLGSQLEREHETLFMMANTDPDLVGLVIDTGHITMGGYDPLALAKKFGKRVIEFHLKDTKPEDRGGTKNIPPPTRDQMKDPYFFPMGSGGVDFPGLKAYLDSIGWRGFLNVELDASPWRPPKESARITAAYITDVLKIPL